MMFSAMGSKTTPRLRTQLSTVMKGICKMEKLTCRLGGAKKVLLKGFPA